MVLAALLVGYLLVGNAISNEVVFIGMVVSVVLRLFAVCKED